MKIGTKLQLAIAASLALVFVLVVMIQIAASIVYEPEHYENVLVLLPHTPAPTPEPNLWPEFHIPYLEDEEEEEIVCEKPRSILTGLVIEEEYIARRPVAVVINNSPDARPQSGIANADIIYEVLAEGSTTRLLLVFQSDIPEKIGPVRSARDYFVDFALNHDAFFVHHGGSPTGYQRIRSLLGINAVDGIRFEGIVFWRDRSYPEWTGIERQRALEHSSYTGWARLTRHMENFEVRDYINEDPLNGFIFGEMPQNASLYQRDVKTITVPYARNVTTTFVYSQDTGMYYLEHIRGIWQDALTEEHVSVANVLIQQTTIRVVDNVGRRSVETVGSGTGFLARGGNVYRVNWQKDDHDSPMRWYFLDGSSVVLAPGRTWINVLQNTAEPIFETAPAIHYEFGETLWQPISYQALSR